MWVHLLLSALFLSSIPLASAQAFSTPLSPSKHIRVRNVVYKNAPLLSAQSQREITKTLRTSEYDSTSDLELQAAVTVQDFYRDRGYYLVEVTSGSEVVADGRADVMVKVLQPGRQYLLASLRWKGQTILSEEQLNNLIVIRPGEIFSRKKIASGIENLRKLYYSKGYPYCTFVPEPEINNETGNIVLTINIDEDAQYVLGNLSVVGLDDTRTEDLLHKWEGVRGQPYTTDVVENFFQSVFRTVPPGIRSSEYTRHAINWKSHIVDYSISFVPQPPQLTSR